MHSLAVPSGWNIVHYGSGLCQMLHTQNRPGIQYIGETKNTLKTRLYGHLSDIRTKKDKSVSNHFNSPNHNINHLTIIGIDASPRLTNLSSRLAKEKFWIQQLRCLTPHGLNIDD